MTAFLALAALLTPCPTPAPVAQGGLVCDPGPGVYFAECNGSITTVQLDATGSSGNGALTFLWSNECANSSFDDPTSPTPILSIDMTGKCIAECGAIQLTVTDSTGSSTCTTAVFVQDTMPPTITCPADLTVQAGDPTDPGSTGTATGSDACNSNPMISFSDVITPDNDPNTPLVQTITRTWTIDDGCFQTSCDQIIRVEEEEPPPGEPDLDIKPGSCPNPINVRSGGVVPVALVGSMGFDVLNVDTSTLILSRTDGVGGTVAPIRIRISDVATPFQGDGCECHTLTSDGIADISLKFKKRDVVQNLLLANEPNGTFIQLQLSGFLFDGTAFSATDCIRINNH